MSIDQQFVEYVIKSIVGNPDDVIVERTIDEKGVLLTLTVNPEDLGRVIGKRGATAQSVRTLLRALGTKNEARYNMKIVDNGEPKSEREAKRAEAESPKQTDKAAAPVDDSTEKDTDNAGGWSSTPSSSSDAEGDTRSNESSAAQSAANDSGEEESVIERTRRELEDLDDLDV